MKLAGCSPPQLTHFGGELAGFAQSFDACCRSHFTDLGGRPQKVEECPKDRQLKHRRMGRVFLYRVFQNDLNDLNFVYFMY